MSLNDFNRNYGMSQNSREYWGGNNGFVTVVVTLPTDVEIGATALVESDVTGAVVTADQVQTALTAAQYNQFKIAEILGSRCVLVTTSVPNAAVHRETMTPAVDSNGDFEDSNIIAYGTAGAITSGSYGITYIVERQDVLTKQTNKPGATYALTVDPTTDIASDIAQAGFFRTKEGLDAGAAVGVAVKVFKALPAIIA